MFKVLKDKRMDSSLVIAAHQPNFMPNLGFFYKMAQVDLFVIPTNLQFERQEGWQRRNKFKNAGADFWMTVPLLGSQNQLIKDVKIKYERDWTRKHKISFRVNYGKTEEQEFLSKLEGIFDLHYERLVDLNFAIIKLIKEVLGIKTEVVLDEDVSGTKHELIANICEKYGGKVYLSGSGASYMTEDRVEFLESKGIKHSFIEHNPVPAGIFSYSAVHYIFEEGGDATAMFFQRNIPLPIAK